MVALRLTSMVLISLFVSPVLAGDPGIGWGTYFGGLDADAVHQIEMLDGDAIIYGETYSTELAAVPGSMVPSAASGTLFVSRIDPETNQVEWITYLGGSALERTGELLITDAGEILITAYTESSDFPMVGDSYDATYNLGGDTVLALLDPTGALVYSTFLGGDRVDFPAGVHEEGGVVTFFGYTESEDHPLVAPIYSATRSGPRCAIVGQLDLGLSGASQLTWCTYYGSEGVEGIPLVGFSVIEAYYWSAGGIDVDANGVVTVVGTTDGGGALPLVDPFQSTPGVFDEGFIARLDPAAPTGVDSLLYSSWLGGDSVEALLGVEALDADRVMVIGYTLSSDFPVTTNAVQPTYSGANEDTVIVVLDTGEAGSAQLEYSTYLGWQGSDNLDKVEREPTGPLGVLTMAGNAGSGMPTTPDAIFPTSSPVPGPLDDFQAALVRVDLEADPADAITYASFLAPTGTGYITDFVRSGSSYLMSGTFYYGGSSLVFPGAPLQPMNAGDYDGYVLRLDFGLEFRRGDASDDGAVDIADAVFILSSLFSGGTEPSCASAADANDDDTVDISDAVTILGALFVPGSPPIPAPNPDCGLDPTPGALECDATSGCP